MSGGHDCCACSPSWAIFFPARRSFNLLSLSSRPLGLEICLFSYALIVGSRRRLWWFPQGIDSALCFTGSTFSSRGGCLFAFTPSKNSFTWACTIVLFSSSVLSYGNFSRGFRGGPYLYCLSPLLVLLDGGADGAAAASVFFRACLRGGGEGLRRVGAAGAAAGLFRPCWRGGEGGGCWLLGSAGAGGEGGGVLPRVP